MARPSTQPFEDSLRRVIDYGKEKRLRRIYGDVLAENAAMLLMCAELGFRQQDRGRDFKRVVLDLKRP